MPHIESSVDLGIVWEVECGGGAAQGTCESFHEVQIKDLTAPDPILLLTMRRIAVKSEVAAQNSQRKSAGSCGRGATWRKICKNSVRSNNRTGHT